LLHKIHPAEQTQQRSCCRQLGEKLAKGMGMGMGMGMVTQQVLGKGWVRVRVRVKVRGCLG
jgi:hypothetical protein